MTDRKPPARRPRRRPRPLLVAGATILVSGSLLAGCILPGGDDTTTAPRDMSVTVPDLQQPADMNTKKVD